MKIVRELSSFNISKGLFIWQTGNMEKTKRTTSTTLQGRMQAWPPSIWHKHRLLGSYCHRQRCLETHSKTWVITIWRTQRVKADEKRLRKKTVCLVSRPTTAFTCSKCGRDCHCWIGLHSHIKHCTMGANLWSLETDRCHLWYIFFLC